ncbi:very short patch repair endonuclease [Pseudomonas sp. BMS12]|uniref:very short patch repair endonuclease n=1 Tax=Pseudomonas sp. BMS12 TaxID=1796033 RepID=UPI0022A97828|nr:DNA mismatch endonuclease Vsr [Pseudomonas sp. BMS12]
MDRSEIMRSVRREHTTPELVVRRSLHRLGFRFRLHRKDLPGSPDIVLPRFRTVIFVHGCFWHRHPGCRYTTTPQSRQNYWLPKFMANVERDQRSVDSLRESGWRVVIVWACETKLVDELDQLLLHSFRLDEPVQHAGVNSLR